MVPSDQILTNTPFPTYQRTQSWSVRIPQTGWYW